MESDPHVLVALAAVAIERVAPAGASPTVHRIVDDRNVSHHSPPVFVTLPAERIGATVQEHTSPTGYRIVNDHDVNCAVFDAIASISVSNVGQVVAVALEMEVSKQVAVLTVANNWGVEPDLDLIAYLNGLWRFIRIMSTRCEKARQEVDPTACIRTQLPIGISEAVKPWRAEFIKRVYRYCMPTNIELFKSQWEPLKHIIRSFLNQHDPEDQVIDKQLNDIFYSLNVVGWFVGRVHHITDEDWGDLICLMDGTVLDIERILDDPTLCEKWAAELKCQLLVPSTRASLC